MAGYSEELSAGAYFHPAYAVALSPLLSLSTSPHTSNPKFLHLIPQPCLSPWGFSCLTATGCLSVKPVSPAISTFQMEWSQATPQPLAPAGSYGAGPHLLKGCGANWPLCPSL